MKKIDSKLKRKIRNRKKIKDVNRDKLRITVYKSKKNICKGSGFGVVIK